MSNFCGRRRGHQQTPVVIGLICLISVPLSGAMTLAREAARAHKAHITLESSEKWLAFGRGCALALGTLLAVTLFVAVWVGIVIWRDNRRFK